MSLSEAIRQLIGGAFGVDLFLGITLTIALYTVVFILLDPGLMSSTLTSLLSESQATALRQWLSDRSLRGRFPSSIEKALRRRLWVLAEALFYQSSLKRAESAAEKAEWADVAKLSTPEFKDRRAERLLRLCLNNNDPRTARTAKVILSYRRLPRANGERVPA